jgi:FtsX-like permease family
MGAVLAWFRLVIRRRWMSLVVLALLIAIAVGTVTTAVAGARRGASAMERLMEQTLPATLLVASVRPGFDWDPVRSLPGVEAVAEVVFSGFEIDGRPADDTFMLPPADTEAMSTVERPVVLAGRLADPARADEVVVTPAFAANHGVTVGDTVAIGLYTPHQIDAGEGPSNARTNLGGLWILTSEQQVEAIKSGVAHNQTWPAEGPVVEATVVGVVRSPLYGDRLGTPGFVIPSAGLYAEYAPNLLGAQRLASVEALVRLADGAEAIADFSAALAEVTGRGDIAIHDLAAAARAIEDTHRFEAAGLLVLATAAAVAGVFLVGVAVARFVVASVADLSVLQALGMTPGQARWAAVAGPTVAAAVGAVLAAAAAVAVSRWFPIGSAALSEPAPGIDVDTVVLISAVLVVPVLAGAGAMVAAEAARRAAPRATYARRSAVTVAAARKGVPIPIVVGARFALEPGRGQPVRPALIGSVVGVTGLLAALVFSAAVTDAAENPARSGVVHQLEAWVGYDNVALAPADAVFSAIADVPGIAGVNDIRGQVAVTGGAQVTVLSFGAPLDYVVTTGRMPGLAAEVLLSQFGADVLGAGVGDTVTLSGTAGEAQLDVVGIGVIDRDFGPAAVTTPDGYDALFDGEFAFQYAEITVASGVDPEAIMADLYRAAPTQDFGLFPFQSDSPAELGFMRPLPLLLAAFVALLGLVTVGHALAAAASRRRHDLAVLRAVGFTPRQSRVVIVVQGTVLALVGLAIGLPLGTAIGRTVWRYVAESVYIHYVPPTVWITLALIGPAVVAVAVALAAWPARKAASLPLGTALRTE